ncbi:MAG TPA: ABC transporter permease, partial [Candidatus Limnocylindrales bacterium]|nr:ABC transporter permease [Candidatus Limnocylindrales bacterium]
MLLQEIRHAFRLIVRSPGFTIIAILSLALGIGANAAMFSLADALVLRPLPVSDPNSVMDVSAVHPGTDSGSLTYPDYLDLRNSARSLDGLVAFELSTFSMARTKDDVARMRMGMLVSDNFFQVMGVQPVLGRGFLPKETSATAVQPAVILGHDFWRDQFQSDPQVAGRTVRIAGIDCNVIGVAPERFTGMDQYVRPSFFIPAAMMQRLTAAEKDPLKDRNAFGWNAEARLRPGISQATAQSELSTLWKSLQQEYPGPSRNRNMAVRTQLQARFASDPFDPILATMLMALATLVLLIACANLANLLLTRARGRAREIAVRIALGVSRARLLRQLMIENVVLALIGAVAGLGFGYLGIWFLRNIPIPTDLPIVIAPQLDG